ncbi:MAG: HAMP domain-containing sensor histidine kinase [Elusimicrobiota bacterium]
MTIKSRLFITFFVLVSLVVLMGTVLVVFGVKNKGLSEQSMLYYSRLFFWREIYQAFDLQSRSLKYYVILGDNSEKDRYREQFDLIKKRVSEVQQPDEDLTAWILEYNELNGIVEKNFYSKSREKLFDSFSTDISKRNTRMKTALEASIKNNQEILDSIERKILELNTFSFIFSFSTGILAILMGGFMSVLIFRSIARPLSVLQKGTKIIGEGNLDYQIPIESGDEIGQLAKSFNQMVQNLHNLQLQIIQMDRMSSIGQLAGGVAHEINNPLTGVLGQAQLLLEKYPQGHPHRPLVERIESAAQRCRRIVRALLDFARDKNYNFYSTDIHKLMLETLDFTKTEMESRKIDLNNHIPVELPQLKISSGHIQQVFLNIISNAIHAMPGGGKLTISAAVSKNFMEIAFTDTGMGIKRENVGHVFDPFFTTKEIGKGTGLGLTISYGIIQRHNGEIIAKSEGEGKGSSFTVRLPVSADSRR